MQDKNDIKSHFISELADLKAKFKGNQLELARCLGIKNATLSRVSTGQKPSDTLVILTKKLHSEFFEERERLISETAASDVKTWASACNISPEAFMETVLRRHGQRTCDELIAQQRFVRKPQEPFAFVSPRATLESLSVDTPVVITDAAGKTLWINRQFTEMCGYEPDELSGKKPGSLLQGPETDQKTVEQMRKAIRNHDGVGVDIVNYHKNKSTYRARIEIAPIKRDGNLIGFVAAEQVIERQEELRRAANGLAETLSEAGAFERFTERTERRLDPKRQ